MGDGDDQITAHVDELLADQAARERTRQRWLQQQALESAQLSGVLLAMAESAATVTLLTVAGHQHQGTLTDVTADHCRIITVQGSVVLLRLSAVSVVTPDRSLRAAAAADDRPAPAGPRFAEALSDRAGERPEVTVRTVGRPDPVVGRLLAVGSDVMTLQVDERRRLAYVSLASVTDVSFLAASG